jgi:uncharacterized protein YndB with AHSA1/START domain
MSQSFEAIVEQSPDGHPRLRLSRVFHVPRHIVFNAWSSAEHISQWFSPQTYSTPEARIEMKAGGVFEVCMCSPSGERHWTRGHFVEVNPGHRLVIDMQAQDNAGRALFRAYTEVDFSNVPGGTRLDVLQSYTLLDPAVATAMIGGAREGWRTTLDKLEAHAAQLTAADMAGPCSVAHGIFHIERTYDAPAARVWKALTDVNAKARWFAGAPGRWDLIQREMDVRVGGREILEGRWDSGVVTTFEATYHDVVEQERLVYAYAMLIDDRKISVSLATIELFAEGKATRLKVTEQGAFLDGYDDAGSREQGTGSLLDALGASLQD